MSTLKLSGSPVVRTPQRPSRNINRWTPSHRALLQKVHGGVKKYAFPTSPPPTLRGQTPHSENQCQNNGGHVSPTLEKLLGNRKEFCVFPSLLSTSLYSVGVQQIFVKLNIYFHVASYMFVCIRSYSFNKYLLQTHTFEICIDMVRIFKVQAGFLIISHLAS